MIIDDERIILNGLHMMIEDDLELPYKPCKDILEELQSDKFVQCSRFTVINKDYIECIDEVNRYIKLFGRKELVEIGIVLRRGL